MNFRNATDTDRNCGFADITDFENTPAKIGETTVKTENGKTADALVVIDLYVATAYLENGPENENESPHASGFDTGFYYSFLDGDIAPETIIRLFETLPEPIDARVLVGLGFKPF